MVDHYLLSAMRYGILILCILQCFNIQIQSNKCMNKLAESSYTNCQMRQMQINLLNEIATKLPIMAPISVPINLICLLFAKSQSGIYSRFLVHKPKQVHDLPFC